MQPNLKNWHEHQRGGSLWCAVRRRKLGKFPQKASCWTSANFLDSCSCSFSTICVFISTQTLAHESIHSKLLDWRLVEMAFIRFPPPTLNEMDPSRSTEPWRGNQEARQEPWSGTMCRAWVGTSKIQLIMCPWCSYHNCNHWNNCSSFQEMSKNFSEPRYLGIEEDCQTSRTQGDLIILLFSSPISPGECVMRRGFLPTSPPVFVYVVVSTFIAMKTLHRGCRWWSQGLARRWLCERSLEMTRWSTSFGPLRAPGSAGVLEKGVSGRWGDFEVHGRKEVPYVLETRKTDLHMGLELLNWVLKGCAGPLHNCKWHSKCFSCRCDHWMTSRFSWLLRAWNS